MPRGPPTRDLIFGRGEIGPRRMAAQPVPLPLTSIDATDSERTTLTADREAERRDIGTEPTPPAPRLQRFWQRSTEVGKAVVSLTGGLIAIITLVVGATIVVESLLEKTVTVRPLSVPKALSDDGISPEIVALNLRDGLNTLVDDVKHSSRGWQTTEIMDPEELPDVAVPSVGLSAQALAADVRAFFKIQNRTVISGEIVSRGDSYSMTLRLNGRPFFHSPHERSRDHLDDMIREGAFATLKLTQPAAAAAVLFDNGDLKQAIAICESLIGKQKSTQDLEARTLRARALSSLGRVQEAIADDRTTSELYPTAAPPHSNLGALLLGLHRPEEAVAELRAAIALNPDHGRTHTSLGQALLSLGRTEEAMKELDTGIAVAHGDWWPNVALGNVLRAAGRVDDALKQYRTAVPLAPDHAQPHRALAYGFQALGQYEEAVAEYRKAVTLDPVSADARRKLATALDDLGRHDEASVERAAAEEIERAATTSNGATPPDAVPQGAASQGTAHARGPEVSQSAAP